MNGTNVLLYNLSDNNFRVTVYFLFLTRFIVHRTALKREDVEFSMPLHEARTGKENEAEVEEGQEDKV
jgi:hypothetical protein